MRILIAEDDATSRAVLTGILNREGHEVTVTVNGGEAWQVLQQPDAPPLAILDWMMPLMNGPEVVRRVRARPTDQPLYLMMLTTRGEKSDIIAGLRAGANDYLAKPFDPGELLARVEVARRMIEMQAEVHQAFAQIKTLLSAEQEAQQRFERMFRHNPAPMALSMLPERRFTDANDAFLKALGYDRADLIGKTAVELRMSPPDQQAAVVEKLQAKGRIVDLELQFRRKDGTLFEGIFSGELISIHGQEYFLTVIIDITDRKQAGMMRVKLEAQHRQLEKSESLGRMAGAIAHHFNNQLQAVMGRLELATMIDLPPHKDLSKNLAQAMTAAGRAAEMSSLMLVYLGQTPDALEPLDLTATCARSLAPLRADLPPGVTLEADLSGPGPVINANAIRLQQLLTNLVANAREAIEDREGTIRLAVTTVSAADIPPTLHFPLDWQPQAQAYACLAVTDTGEGIAGPDIEKIFDPFFSTKFTGRGLGLAVVLGIVRSHSGAVTVESQPGRGSTFRLFFPTIAQVVPPQPPDKVAHSLAMEGGGTVLLVEDDELVRTMVAEMLTMLGFTVLTAADGVEAVELFRQRQAEIDCVLSDLTMPRMDGWETLTALRQIAPDIPVILSSGYDEAQVMAGHHPELPQAFLGKPYQLAALKDALAGAMVK